MSKKEIEVSEKYTYNADTDTYIVPMKHRVKPFVIRGYKVRSIRKAISNSLSPSETSATVCLKYKLQEVDLDAVRKAFNITRESFPLTDEEVLENPIEQSKDSILDEKRSILAQVCEKEEWKETQKDATTWRNFQNRILDPFTSAILDGELPIAPPVRRLPQSKTKVIKNTLVIGLNDLHWGAYANPRYMYNDKGGWDSAKTTEVVDKYCQAIIETTSERTYQFKKVAVFLLGDILHSMSGKTCRGTDLKFDLIREEQFEAAMSALSRFITNIIANFNEVEVHTIGGNHNYEAELALYRALEAYFRNEKNIKFTHYTTRPASFQLENTLFLIDHGQDSGEKTGVPLTENKLENHVQNLLLQKPEKLIGVNSKVFVMGDRHHHKHLEFDNFDFVMFSTPLGADEHAAVNNWNNRARQSCLIIDENGIKEVLHFYTNALLK